MLEKSYSLIFLLSKKTRETKTRLCCNRLKTAPETSSIFSLHRSLEAPVFKNEIRTNTGQLNCG